MMRTTSEGTVTATAESPFVTVVIATCNRREMLAECLRSISALEYPAFEALVCVDPSSVVSPSEVREIAGPCPHIRVLACEGNSGVSATRNAGIAQARGDLVFFTDDDVVVPRDWLERAVSSFDGKDVIGFEGRIVYVADDYRLRYGDRVVHNETGGLYMTANAGYRREPLIEAGMFDEGFPRFQDRELAHRLRALGDIPYAQECVVYHQHDRYTARAFMAEAQGVREMVKLMKLTGDHAQLVGRVYAPSKLAAILFPPLILLRLLNRRTSSRADLMFLVLSWPRLCYERALLWRAAVAERFFVV